MTQQYGLTKRQRTVLDMIISFTAKHGLAPTVREIRDALNLKSIGHVSAILDALVERGYLSRLSGKSRSIVVLTGDETDLATLRKIRDAAIAYISAQQRLRNEYEGDAASEQTKTAGARVGVTLDYLKELVSE